eukprot:scaffold202958_cov33-Tisochrysis_lutea.AAC.2
MLLNLGLSSAVSMTSPLVLSLCEARDWRTSRIAPSLHLLAFLTGLMYVTRSGNYWLELRYALCTCAACGAATLLLSLVVLCAFG